MAKTSSGNSRPSGAETARKVVQVLLHFTRRRPTASVRELSEDLDIATPTLYRYVALLRDMGLLEEASNGTYRLGWRAYQLGQAASVSQGLVPVAEPIMEELARDTDETVILFRLADNEMECIAQVESPQVIRLAFEPGQRLPLTAGASARVLLASLSPDVLGPLLDRLAEEHEDFGSRRADFQADVVQARTDGWAMSREEVAKGLWAVAVPVKHNGRVVAAMSVAGPVYRLTEGDQASILPQAMASAQHISETLENG